jgi:hypothetical protein
VNRAVQHLRANVVAYLALFIALGGTSYAAINLPAGSVGAKQIKNHSITPVKFNQSAIAGNVRAWAIVRANGTVIASSGKPDVTTGSDEPGVYGISWGVSLPKTCATVGNIDFRSTPTETVSIPGGGTENIVAGYVSQVHTQASSSPDDKRPVTGLVTLDQAGHPTSLAFDVAIIC